MNCFIKPEMRITYFGSAKILMASETPNYAANNMNLYMTGTMVKAIQTRTIALQSVLDFSQ